MLICGRSRSTHRGRYQLIFPILIISAGTTAVSSANDAVTTMRIVYPQTASPVAVAAGLCFSTVSVNAAIQAT